MKIFGVITSLASLTSRNHHDLQNYDAFDDHAQYLNLARHLAIYGLHNAPVRKTADQTVNNSTVLVNDNALLLALAANEIWLVTLYLLQTSPSANSDFKMGWAYPAACSIKWAPVYGEGIYGHWIGCSSGVSPNAIFIQTDTEVIGTANKQQALMVVAIVINGANAGNLNFQWAQGTATAENTVVNANSALVGIKLG